MIFFHTNDCPCWCPYHTIATISRGQRDLEGLSNLNLHNLVIHRFQCTSGNIIKPKSFDFELYDTSTQMREKNRKSPSRQARWLGSARRSNTTQSVEDINETIYLTSRLSTGNVPALLLSTRERNKH